MFSKEFQNSNVYFLNFSNPGDSSRNLGPRGRWLGVLLWVVFLLVLDCICWSSFGWWCPEGRGFRRCRVPNLSFRLRFFWNNLHRDPKLGLFEFPPELLSSGLCRPSIRCTLWLVKKKSAPAMILRLTLDNPWNVICVRDCYWNVSLLKLCCFLIVFFGVVTCILSICVHLLFSWSCGNVIVWTKSRLPRGGILL